jgi:hypothetical protein
MRGSDGDARLAVAGLTLDRLGDKVTVRQVKFGSEAAKYGIGAGDEITAVLTAADRPSRYWIAIPALVVLAGIVILQRRRMGHGRKARRAAA